MLIFFVSVSVKCEWNEQNAFIRNWNVQNADKYPGQNPPIVEFPCTQLTTTYTTALLQ